MNQEFWNLFGSDYRINCLSWHHFAGNPVIPASGDTWKKNWTANPDVLTFNGQMLLFYRGNGIMPEDFEVNKDRIGLARIDSIGPEGLCITELNDGMPIVDVGSNGEFDERFVLDPASVVFEGKVYLYYSAIDNSGNESVGLSISEDGINFRKYGKVLDGRAPEAVVHNGQLMLLYQRHTDDRPESPYNIYLASSPDGINFEDAQPDPVVTKLGRAWDALSIVTCRVEESDGAFYMLYGGSADHADEPEYFGLARSTDLINWERHPGNPIFGCGPKGSEDGGAMWFPALIQQPDCYCLLYEGSRGRYAWELSSQICMSWIER